LTVVVLPEARMAVRPGAPWPQLRKCSACRSLPNKPVRIQAPEMDLTVAAPAATLAALLLWSRVLSIVSQTSPKTNSPATATKINQTAALKMKIVASSKAMNSSHIFFPLRGSLRPMRRG
jgi:hypothetical protein